MVDRQPHKKAAQTQKGDKHMAYKRLGDLLVSAGAITPEELERKLTLLNDALEKTMRTEDVSCIRAVLHRVVPTFHEPEEVNACQGETVEIPAQEAARV